MKITKLLVAMLAGGLILSGTNTYAEEESAGANVSPEMCGYTDKILLGAGKLYLPATLKLVNVSGDIKFEQIDESSFQIKSPSCGSGNVRVAYTYTNISDGANATCELTIDDGAWKNSPSVRDVSCADTQRFKFDGLDFDEMENVFARTARYKIYFGRP